MRRVAWAPAPTKHTLGPLVVPLEQQASEQAKRACKPNDDDDRGDDDEDESICARDTPKQTHFEPSAANSSGEQNGAAGNVQNYRFGLTIVQPDEADRMVMVPLLTAVVMVVGW